MGAGSESNWRCQLPHDRGTTENFRGLHPLHLQAHEKRRVLCIRGGPRHDVAHDGDHLILTQIQALGHSFYC